MSRFIEGEEGATWPPPTSRTTVPEEQLTRPYPALSVLSEESRADMDSLVQDYLQFLDKGRTPLTKTEEVFSRAERFGFEAQGIFSVVNTDRAAFALVRPGTAPLTEGCNIIFTHTDSPTYKVKPVMLVEWDLDLQLLHPGVRIDLKPYGGVLPHQWLGRQVDLWGHMVLDEGTRKVRFSFGSVPDLSAHTEKRTGDYSQMFPQEVVDYITSIPNEDTLLEMIGLEHSQELAQTDLRLVPLTVPRLVHNLIEGYGQDNSICTYAALEAFRRSDPRYTSIFIGFDCEEAENADKSSAGGAFFDEVIDTVIERIGGARTTPHHMYRRQVLDNSIAVSADVDAAPSHLEAEDEHDNDGVDIANIGYLGYGPKLCVLGGVQEGYNPNPRIMHKMLSLFKPSNVALIQVKGSTHKANNNDDSRAHGEYLSRRGLEVVEFGPVGIGLHSPVEIFHNADFYHTILAYQAFLDRKA